MQIIGGFFSGLDRRFFRYRALLELGIPEGLGQISKVGIEKLKRRCDSGVFVVELSDLGPYSPAFCRSAISNMTGCGLFEPPRLPGDFCPPCREFVSTRALCVDLGFHFS